MKTLQGLPEKERPNFALSAATGRPTCFVFGAEIPEPERIAEWCSVVDRAGISRVICGELSLAARIGFHGVFGPDKITAVEWINDVNGVEQVKAALLAARAAREKVVVCGVDEQATALVLGVHVMEESGGSPEEALATLRARVKHSGVKGRVPDEGSFEAFAAAYMACGVDSIPASTAELPQEPSKDLTKGQGLLLGFTESPSGLLF